VDDRVGVDLVDGLPGRPLLAEVDGPDRQVRSHPRGAVAVDADHVDARVGQSVRHSRPDSARDAGDDRPADALGVRWLPRLL
jgi:hypothetical protein